MRTNDRITREELRTALQQAIVANDAEAFTTQFDQMLKMMKQFSNMGKSKQGKKMLGRMKMPF